jgi:hypothetical protein
MSTPRRAVYRALIGGYEALREEEVARESGLPFICFTDDPALTSSTWEVVHVQPRLPNDSTRSARALKILGHPRLEEFDETLWVDNTVALTAAPDEIFDQWLADADVAAPLHSYRSSVVAEAEVVIDSGLDEFARVYEQLAHYLASGRGGVDDNPHWTGMLARRRTPETARAMLAWWEDVLRYSRRDQLSFVPIMREQGVRLHSVPLDALQSVWHEWPRAEGRDTTRVGTRLRETLRPPAARVGALQQQLDDASHALTVAVAQREDVIGSLQRDLGEARSIADASRIELDTVRHERNLAHIDLAAATARARQLEAVVERKTARMRRMKRRIRRLEQRLRTPTGWRRLVPAARRGRRG